MIIKVINVVIVLTYSNNIVYGSLQLELTNCINFTIDILYGTLQLELPIVTYNSYSR